MLSVAEAAALLSDPKKLVRKPPVWKPKPNHSVTGFLQFRSALEVGGVVRQDLCLDGSWRPGDGVRPERFCLAVRVANNRLFAWDVDAAQQHPNQKGIGRPWYRQRIRRHHEHTWSDEGYGYVEPLQLMSYDVCDVWNAFLVAANILSEPCVDPDAGRAKGLYLDLGIT